MRHSLVLANELSADQQAKIIPIEIISPDKYKGWLTKQTARTKNWLETTGFKAENGEVALLQDEHGKIDRVLCCATANLWSVGNLPLQLPQGIYQLEKVDDNYKNHAIAWDLGAYQFTVYKKPKCKPAKLFIPNTVSKYDIAYVQNMVDSIYLVRDWINTPTDDMGPSQFAAAAQKIAHQYDAHFTQIIGEDLLSQNYASIYTVGRASDDEPRLIDLRWGNPKHPKITLVGKGVCFDSGGLDLKMPAYMALMKKDMAGGAHAIGLARMIMAAKLPVYLRVLVPMVENVISGNAYRPGDIIKSRKGLTIEVGNTDAEGRLILADALTEAVSEKPELLIDISTLTGAARVALGTELPALFANSDEVANAVIAEGQALSDPMWRLPLFMQYREFLNSPIADINNNGTEPYAGAITAALFLKEFVPDEIPWLHFDMMAWNLRPRPGRPQGGEASTLRALFSYLMKRFGH